MAYNDIFQIDLEKATGKKFTPEDANFNKDTFDHENN